MIYGKLGLKFTKQLKKFKEYAFKKPMTKKYTGDPMIKTDAYSINSVLKNYPKKQIKSSLKFKKRRELLKKKNEFGVSMARTWNKSSPAGKARRALQTKVDVISSELNVISKEIGELFKTGQAQKANEFKQKTTDLKEIKATLSEELKKIKAKYKAGKLKTEYDQILSSGKTSAKNLKSKASKIGSSFYDKAGKHVMKNKNKYTAGAITGVEAKAVFCC